MNIKTKLKALNLATLVGLGLVIFFTVTGLNATSEAEQAAHRRESYVIDLVEIKASALSTILLDPTTQETKDVFTEAGRNIIQHGDAALKAIKREEIKGQLKKILDQWHHYNEASQALIRLAATDPKHANEQITPLYNQEFKPFQTDLEKFVSARYEEAIVARDQAKRISSKTTLEIITLLVIVAIVSVVVEFNLSLSLRSGLLGIQEKLIPLKRGDLTQRLPTNSKDELSEIALGVNAFVDELQSIVQQTHAHANLVASSALQLASASEQVRANAGLQAEATSSVAAAVEQFTVSLDQVAENAVEADQKATMSGELSRRGGKEVEAAVDEIRRIKEIVTSATHQIESLGHQAQEISSIVNVIKDVADQTNLLALNAAIEAARAGEAGRGFAVVADEVRKLAERTAKSAEEITHMVGSIQSETHAVTVVMKAGDESVEFGVKKAEQAGDSMLQINESSSSVINAVSDISSALREQRIASTEIAMNVEKIAHMTEESSAAIANVSSASAQLERLAEELQQEVAKFST